MKINKSSIKTFIYRWRVRSALIALVVVLALAKPTWGLIGIGVGVCLVGLLIRAWAAGHIRKEKELAVTGPYRYTRNPLYVGSFILGLGLALGSGSWWGLSFYILYFLSFYPVVIYEERDRMRRLFPAAYPEYAKRVPIFLPTLRGFAATDARKWNAAFFQKNKEHRAWIGTAIVWALLLLRWRI